MLKLTPYWELMGRLRHWFKVTYNPFCMAVEHKVTVNVYVLFHYNEII